MNPFEFIILFLSFVYTLALTHLLFSWTRMVRHRRELVLSWPHLLWMLVALITLAENWVSLWDFRLAETLSLTELTGEFLFVMLVYFVCALVCPDFEAGETYDLKKFHAREGPTYFVTFLIMIVAAIITNFLAGADLDVTKWTDENYLVVGMLIPPVLALVSRREWAQLLAPALLLVMSIAYLVIFYPELAS
jgi:hypothetical protein